MRLETRNMGILYGKNYKDQFKMF